MKITGIFTEGNQVGNLVDSLRNMGIDRKDIIISAGNKAESTMDNVYIKTESESISRDNSWNFFTNIYEHKIPNGIIVSVETPKKKAASIKEIFEQNGAEDIIED